MRRELWLLAVQKLKKEKKTSTLMLFVLVMSFAFAVIAVSLTESMNASNQEYRYDTYGMWQAAVFGGLSGDREEYEALSGITIGEAGCYGTLEGNNAIGTLDEMLVQMGRVGMQSGHFPKNDDEIAVEADTLSHLGYGYELGQEITLKITFPAADENTQDVVEEKKYHLCGVIRSYTGLWCIGDAKMPGAVVTKTQAEQLFKEARQQGEKIKPPETQYFFRGAESQAYVLKQVKDRVQKAGSEWTDRSICANLYAKQTAGVTGYPYVYIGMIFALTLAAVVCVYVSQLQEQLQQTALFRSIGITKRQLRLLYFYETLILAAPAALAGIGTGAVGVFLVLHQWILSGSSPVIVKIPFQLLIVLFLLWSCGIAATRIILLQYALKLPLTGQMKTGGRKLLVHRRIERGMAGMLAVMMCGVAFFGSFQFLDLKEQRSAEGKNADYSFFIRNAEGGKPLSSGEIQELSRIPGIQKIKAWGMMQAELVFSGMEECEAVQNLKDSHSMLNDPDYEGLRVWMYGIPEKDCDDYLDFSKLSISREDFLSGRAVIMLFPVEADGRTLTGEAKSNDIGMDSGEQVGLTIYGKKLVADTFGNLTAERTEAPLIHANPEAEIVRIKKDKRTDPLGIFAAQPYTVLSTTGFMEQMISQMPENYQVEPYRTGQESGYVQGQILASENARYLSTDYVLADKMSQYQMELTNNREKKHADMAVLEQSMLLYAACGGTIVLIALLLFRNVAALTAMEELQSVKLLTAIGMSEKQLKRRIAGRAACYGSTAVCAGWLLFFGYLAAWAIRWRQYQITYLGEASDFFYLLQSRIDNYQIAGIGWEQIGICSVLGWCSVAVVSYVTEKSVLLS